METEFTAVTTNGTCTLIPLVPRVNCTDSDWVFKLKLHDDGSIERYKAGLVVKGFKQRYGLDCEKNSRLVVKHVIVHLLLFLILSRGWHIECLLYGFLMSMCTWDNPPDFDNHVKPDLYCNLLKFLYGLIQASRVWHARLSSSIGTLEFSASAADTSLFILSLLSSPRFWGRVPILQQSLCGFGLCCMSLVLSKQVRPQIL
jgi:hypothetical protein